MILYFLVGYVLTSIVITSLLNYFNALDMKDGSFIKEKYVITDSRSFVFMCMVYPLYLTLCFYVILSYFFDWLFKLTKGKRRG